MSPVNSLEPSAVMTAIVELSQTLHGDFDEAELIDRFFEIIARVAPGRSLAVRVVDLHSREPGRVYGRVATLRDGLEHDRLVLSPATATTSRMKSALLASARLRLDERWDSPFGGIATGAAIPLVAGAELYGVFDVGYRAGEAPPMSEAAALLPLVNQLAVALRTMRLHRDTLELRDYQARLVENANALIVGIDRAWRVTVCNRALLEVVGATRDDLVGHDLRDLIPADQRRHVTAVFTAALHGETRSAVDLVLNSRDHGRVRTVWSVAAIGNDQRGQDHVDAVVAIGQDQSRLHALEEQVIRSERLATLGQLAAGVVHEINNPLMSINVYADFLVKRFTAAGSDDADLEKLRRIGGSAQRIQRFTRELMQYARPPGHDIELVVVNDVVRQSVSICEHLFDRGGISVDVELDDGLPAVHAVAGQLEQVVINLVTNAAHAVEGGGTISVRTRQLPNATVELEISDSGAGVPDGDGDRIFEPFFTTKPDGKGTGLGLSIVRNIVESHHGRISVARSTLGGAAFSVRLPIA